MTETSPLGTIFSLKKGMEDYSEEQLTEMQLLQGRGYSALRCVFLMTAAGHFHGMVKRLAR